MSSHAPDLRALGLDPEVSIAIAMDERVALVTAQQRGSYTILTNTEERTATLRGRLIHRAAQTTDLPTVGDHVVVRIAGDGPALIERVLERRSLLARTDPGGTSRSQPLAANVDVAFIVSPLDRPLNRPGTQRYLSLCWEAGVEPIVVLTKPDLHWDVRAAVSEASSAAPGADVLIANGLNGDGVDDLQQTLASGRVGVMLGPSGAGKSTLINRMARTDRRVRETYAEGKGRHTTTSRDLIALPSGGAIIDTPGLREVGLGTAEKGVSEVFADIDELAESCRFRDCTHRSEPGCAVLAGMDAGSLAPGRLDEYRKFEREVAYEMRRSDERAAREVWRKWKGITKSMRDDPRVRRR